MSNIIARLSVEVDGEVKEFSATVTTNGNPHAVSLTTGLRSSAIDWLHEQEMAAKAQATT